MLAPTEERIFRIEDRSVWFIESTDLIINFLKNREDSMSKNIFKKRKASTLLCSQPLLVFPEKKARFDQAPHTSSIPQEIISFRDVSQGDIVDSLDPLLSSVVGELYDDKNDNKNSNLQEIVENL
ncbi:hypothetical protein ACH42_04055 [Endozoicomonas sp. (ex Bugula neritina AB1)]|nr:hypothetical protein ACH42_04055 [Endozoicomonas sp. (ex Bugula neritina AB1)]